VAARNLKWKVLKREFSATLVFECTKRHFHILTVESNQKTYVAIYLVLSKLQCAMKNLVESKERKLTANSPRKFCEAFYLVMNNVHSQMKYLVERE
jgi:hypothetical protein